MLLMFYQLYYARCLIVLRIFKQDNASVCLDNDQLVTLWPQERLKLLQLFTPT